MSERGGSDRQARAKKKTAVSGLGCCYGPAMPVYLAYWSLAAASCAWRRGRDDLQGSCGDVSRNYC